MTASQPDEAVALGAPRWGEPRRRPAPQTSVADVSTHDVTRLVARREARAAFPDETPTPPSPVDALLARRAARTSEEPVP